MPERQYMDKKSEWKSAVVNFRRGISFLFFRLLRREL